VGGARVLLRVLLLGAGGPAPPHKGEAAQPAPKAAPSPQKMDHGKRAATHTRTPHLLPWMSPLSGMDARVAFLGQAATSECAGRI